MLRLRVLMGPAGALRPSWDAEVVHQLAIQAQSIIAGRITSQPVVAPMCV